MIDYHADQGSNKENMNFNGIINEATWKEKKTKGQPHIDDETFFKYLHIQAESIEQLLL